MEIVTLLIAVVALLLAAVSYLPNRKLLARLRELDDIEKLKEEREENASKSAPNDISARICKNDDGEDVLRIENVSDNPLYLADLKQSHGGSCIPEYEVREHLPIRKFSPNQVIDIPVFIDVGTLPSQTFTLIWLSEKKDKYSKRYHVSVM